MIQSSKWLALTLCGVMMTSTGYASIFDLGKKDTKQQTIYEQQKKGLGFLKAFKQKQTKINTDYKKLSISQLQALIKQQKTALKDLQQATQLLNKASWAQQQTKTPLIRQSSNAQKPYHWVKTSAGHAVKHMVTAGYNQQGAVHACQAFHKGGLHPGQLTAQGCHISYAGKAFFVKKYAVLVSQLPNAWLRGDSKNVYSNQFSSSPIPAGYEGGHALYSCWVMYKGQPHVGKTVTGACDIAYHGKEIRTVSIFHVMSTLLY
ncbi:MAG: DUF3421 domain-containing protein [Coxiellaceae bacterium]|nr:DUF3421 domain-containing protein [Coxiellaceae bacterium]